MATTSRRAYGRVYLTEPPKNVESYGPNVYYRGVIWPGNGGNYLWRDTQAHLDRETAFKRLVDAAVLRGEPVDIYGPGDEGLRFTTEPARLAS